MVTIIQSFVSQEENTLLLVVYHTSSSLICFGCVCVVPIVLVEPWRDFNRIFHTFSVAVIIIIIIPALAKKDIFELLAVLLYSCIAASLSFGSRCQRSMIYKISTRIEWDAAQAAGVFQGAPIDLADGFIHFSTKDQVAVTTAKYFAGQTDLILAGIDDTILGDALIYEHSPSRGELFPHLYSPLSMKAILWTKPITLGEDGVHILPNLDARE